MKIFLRGKFCTLEMALSNDVLIAVTIVFTETSEIMFFT